MGLTIVGDGVAAVEAWRNEAFDVILMDVEMPLMDGPRATRAIRAEERARTLTPMPIIALTANAMPQQIEAYIAAGMDAVVTKPINLSELLDTLAHTLAKPRIRKRERRRRKA